MSDSIEKGSMEPWARLREGYAADRRSVCSPMQRHTQVRLLLCCAGAALRVRSVSQGATVRGVDTCFLDTCRRRNRRTRLDGYCGRYEINEQERSVIFRLELSSYPNLTGTAQKRFVEIAGNRLKISTPPALVRGKLMVNTVVWERPK